MRKINLASICLFIFSFAFSQTHVEVKIDTVKVVSGELTIQNATKNVQGFLYNTGNGATSFKRGAIKLNDTTYVIGADTLHIPRAIIAQDAILNQYANQQTARAWFDTSRTKNSITDSLQVGNRYTAASPGMGTINIDSAAARQGIILWGSDPNSTTGQKYLRIYWSSSNGLAITGVGATSQLTISPPGAQTAFNGNINVGGIIMSGGGFQGPFYNALVSNGTVMPYGFSNARATVTTVNGSGYQFTSQSAGNGSTDKNAGDFTFTTGRSTGTGSANFLFQTAAPGSTGTTDNIPDTRLKIFGTGDVIIQPSGGTFIDDSKVALQVKTTTKLAMPYPVMTAAQRDAISSPTQWGGVICSDCTATDGSTGVLQIYNGSSWKNAW